MGDNFESEMTEMLILHVVSPDATYGFDIAQQVMERSQGHLALKEGELYSILHRLERQGMLRSYWVALEADRRRKYYLITAQGEKLLEARRAQWSTYAAGVDGVLGVPQWTDCFGVG